MYFDIFTQTLNISSKLSWYSKLIKTCHECMKDITVQIPEWNTLDIGLKLIHELNLLLTRPKGKLDTNRHRNITWDKSDLGYDLLHTWQWFWNHIWQENLSCTQTLAEISFVTTWLNKTYLTMSSDSYLTRAFFSYTRVNHSCINSASSRPASVQRRDQHNIC